MHWRQAALNPFPELAELISDDIEEYALYNFLFECKERFDVAFKRNNRELVIKIKTFIEGCLDYKLDSDGEKLAIAAGASFAEHLFADEEKTNGLD